MIRKVRVLINPKSGLVWSFGAMQRVLERCWDAPEIDLSYQFSKSPEDGQTKVRCAIDDGVDTVLIVGGDGMVNSIGSELVGTDVALGVIPAGSGNGFARHFDIPLNPEMAAKALFTAKKQRIDVGVVNGTPFFVTCSMAWDAALVRTFEKSPVRGVLPYVFAAVYEFFGYVPHEFKVLIDGTRKLSFADPMVMTAANLTQYGGGAKIAPEATPDDGCLELIVLLKRDVHKVLPQMNRLFDGTFTDIPQVQSYRFKQLQVMAARPGPLQVDGELIDPVQKIDIEVRAKALTVLVPS